jgi:hypothetical protein
MGLSSLLLFMGFPSQLHHVIECSPLWFLFPGSRFDSSNGWFVQDDLKPEIELAVRGEKVDQHW